MILDEATASVDADKILVIDDGRIVESGNHAQLMQQNGMYARMVSLQAIRSLAG